jgi:hypothetical protein
LLGRFEDRGRGYRRPSISPRFSLKNPKEEERLQEYSDWKQRYDTREDHPRELFWQVSNIAIYMSYDLIDKLRWWEKETLKLSDEKIHKRIPHLAGLLENLKTAYLDFSYIDLLGA